MGVWRPWPHGEYRELADLSNDLHEDDASLSASPALSASNRNGPAIEPMVVLFASREAVAFEWVARGRVFWVEDIDAMLDAVVVLSVLDSPLHRRLPGATGDMVLETSLNGIITLAGVLATHRFRVTNWTRADLADVHRGEDGKREGGGDEVEPSCAFSGHLRDKALESLSDLGVSQASSRTLSGVQER